MEKILIKKGDLVFININRNMKRKKFIKLFKVKRNTYFYNLYSRLYDFILGGSINLYKEYKKYYKKEFKSFSIFLSEKYNLNDEIIKKLNTKRSYYKKFDSMCDQPVYSLAQDESVKKIIYDFFGGYIYGY